MFQRSQRNTPKLNGFNPQDSHYNTIIIGAGPTGLVCSHLLNLKNESHINLFGKLIFATGYRFNFPFLKSLPGMKANQLPSHQDGIIPHIPGLYILGIRLWMRIRVKQSSLIREVGRLRK